MWHKRSTCCILQSGALALGLIFWGRPAMAEVLRLAPMTATARGVNVANIQIPEDLDPKNIQLTVTADFGAGAGQADCVIRFSPTSWHSLTVKENREIVLALFRCADEAKFVFPEPGSYGLEWLVATGLPDRPTLRVVQTAQVSAARIADTQFIRRVLEQYRARAPREAPLPHSDSNIDVGLAVEILTAMLEAPQTITPDDVWRVTGSAEAVSESADNALLLGLENPNSSYAPYAAFLSGMQYLSLVGSNAMSEVRQARAPGQPKDRAAEFVQRSELLKGDARFAKGVEALDFAVKRGDAYLVPIATYHLGFLRACGGDIEAGEQLLDQAVASGGERGTIGEMVNKVRPELKKMKEAIENRP